MTSLVFFNLAAVLTHPLVAQAPPESVVSINRGNLSATFRDNSDSPQMLSGIASLRHLEDEPGFDAFDPDTPGASAGLNFEHIISGHRNPNNKFTPRHGRYTLHRLRDRSSVMLVRSAEDSPWKVASTLTYTVKEPHYIDFVFRCTCEDADLFGQRRYGLFFFANYMNDVDDVSLHFRGKPSANASEQWIAADAPAGPGDWGSGGNYLSLNARQLTYDDDVDFRLNTWAYDWPRISKPFYYGRAGKSMTMMLMFDRLHSSRDQIRFSLYKFKLAQFPRPAWDFQYVVNRVETGVEYGFRGRLVWKRFVSPQDCIDEYEHWKSGLADLNDDSGVGRVQRLESLGATVFTRGTDVIEVNANRTRISDADLALLDRFKSITDLSLEETVISDRGIAKLGDLPRLEWLNLYRTRIGNQSLRLLCEMNSLQHLPIGETNVTDAGLKHVGRMKQLVYLGLRGNEVTDAGLGELVGLNQLTGLHLGETKITDRGLIHLEKLRLKKLWLNQTAVTDRAIDSLAKMVTLSELYLSGTGISQAGSERLIKRLPRCRVVLHAQ